MTLAVHRQFIGPNLLAQKYGPLNLLAQKYGLQYKTILNFQPLLPLNGNLRNTS